MNNSFYYMEAERKLKEENERLRKAISSAIEKMNGSDARSSDDYFLLTDEVVCDLEEALKG